MGQWASGWVGQSGGELGHELAELLEGNLAVSVFVGLGYNLDVGLVVEVALAQHLLDLVVRDEPAFILGQSVWGLPCRTC